jgi:hypothetical protein
MVKYLLALLLLIPSFGYATTYTVCNEGCTGTGIQAVINSTDLNAGDILEVRADTEGGSKTYTEKITIGAADSGDATAQVIIRARAGDAVTINSNGIACSGNNCSAVWITGNYITLDGFIITGMDGTLNTFCYGVMVYGSNESSRATGNIVQNNSVIITESTGTVGTVRAIGFQWTETGVIKNNTVTTFVGDGTKQYDGIYLQSAKNTDINGNTVTLSMTGTGHNDPISVAGGNGNQIPFNSCSNVIIRNNILLQNNSQTNYRQFIYIEYEVLGYTSVYNNVMWKPSGNGSYSLYRNSSGNSGPFYLYNNSMYIGGNTAGCYATNVADSYIKGNSCYINGTGPIFELKAVVPDANINYNVGYKPSAASAYRLNNAEANAFYTFTQWQALGYDAAGAFDNPDYTAVTDPPNFVPATGSPLIDAFPTASAPTSLFTNDILNADRPSGSAWDVGAYEKGGSADTTPPTISSATIDATGTTLTIVFSEPVVVNTSTGFTLDMDDGTGEGLTYASGSTTNTLVYNITGRMIETDAEGTLDYVTVTNGIEDLVGNDLASTGESDITVMNNSEHTPTVDSFTVTPSTSAGCAISPAVASTVPTGETKAFTCTAASANHSCVAWTGTCGGTGTTSFTSSAIKSDCTVIQPCFKIAPEITIGSGAAVTIGSGAVGTLQ